MDFEKPRREQEARRTRMPRGTRGVFYSVMTVLLLAPTIALALFYLNAVHPDAEQAAVKVRADELSHFLESTSLDLSRFMLIASKNSLIAIVKYEEDYNATVADAACVLSALSYYGNATNDSCAGVTLSANITLPTQNGYLLYWQNRTIAAGAKFGFNTSIALQSQSYNMAGPFLVNYSLVMRVNSTEKSGLMNFSRTVPVSINVSIIGLDDPLYLLKTQGIVRRNINSTNATQGGSNISAMVAAKFYAASNNSASFLDRLEGNLSLTGKYGNETGMETFVHGPELESYGFALKNQSSLDLHYFNDSLALGQGCNLNELSCGEYSWFKLDAATAARYGVSLNCTKCS